MMTENWADGVNWSEQVGLELRGCQRPDLSYRFSPFAAGDLATMIARALSWTDKTRDRLAIRSARLGHLGPEQILELSQQPGFPHR